MKTLEEHYLVRVVVDAHVAAAAAVGVVVDEMEAATLLVALVVVGAEVEVEPEIWNFDGCVPEVDSVTVVDARDQKVAGTCARMSGLGFAVAVAAAAVGLDAVVGPLDVVVDPDYDVGEVVPVEIVKVEDFGAEIEEDLAETEMSLAVGHAAIHSAQGQVVSVAIAMTEDHIRACRPGHLKVVLEDKVAMVGPVAHLCLGPCLSHVARP